MKYFPHRVRALEQLLKDYRPPQPFNVHLKSFFKLNRQYGSRDRRELKQLAFTYWRMGSLIKLNDLAEKMAVSIFLLEPIGDWALEYISDSIQKELTPLKKSSNELDLEKLIEMKWFDKNQFSKFESILSSEIDSLEYRKSMFLASNLWIRILNNEKQIQDTVENHESYKRKLGKSLEFTNGSDLEGLLKRYRRDYTVQDISSQKVVERIATAPDMSIFDCCAGSGGKTLSIWNLEPRVKLFVSDVREAIIRNLNQRFQKHRLRDFNWSVQNIVKGQALGKFKNSLTKSEISESEFDLVLCDMPCSGSGTWSRNPEALSKFKIKDLEKYQDRQRKILQSASSYMKNSGAIWYLTCSVFEKENEDVVESFLSKNQEFSLVQSGYENWLNNGGDCIYFAEIRKEK